MCILNKSIDKPNPSAFDHQRNFEHFKTIINYDSNSSGYI